MSLINDALKRAQETQEENPPTSPPLEFRPVEPGQKEKRRTTLLVVGLTLVLIAILGLAGALIWFVSQSKSVPLPVAARVVDPPLPQPSQVAVPAADLTNTPVMTESHALGEVLKPLDEPATNGLPVVAAIVEAVVPPALKLQGIFFNPQNPSAVVNGRSVYLGDRVSGFRVMGISPIAVTFVNGAETNVLSLSGQ